MAAGEGQASPAGGRELSLNLQDHIAYLRGCVFGGLPSRMAGLDSNRLTLAYFCVSGLDLLDNLTDDDRQSVAEWVLRLQKDSKGGTRAGGFRGSTFFVSKEECGGRDCGGWDRSHVAMTYTAISLLLICQGNLDGVDKEGIEVLIRELQGHDGCLRAHQGDCESDARFIFCAAACCHMIDRWSGLDTDAASAFIMRCKTPEGGFSLIPGQEAHGGSTYCCIAALALMGKLELLNEGRAREKLIRWCIQRQVGGFQGRTNKPADTCYSFWIGATLKVIGAYNLVDVDSFSDFSLMCQNRGALMRGGFSKGIGGSPDPLHTYMSLCGLSLGEDKASRTKTRTVKQICPLLGFSVVASARAPPLPRSPWEDVAPQ